MKPKAILFDMGSTIFPYTEEDARYFLKNFFIEMERRSKEINKDLINEYVDVYLKLVRDYGNRAAALDYKEEDLLGRLKRFWNASLIEPSDKDVWIDEHRKAFLNSIWVPKEKVKFLKSLSKEVPLGVVTNYPDRETIEYVIESFGMKEIFSAVSVSGEVGYRKPHKRIFLNALSQIGLKPAREVVMVGDRWLEDIEGARAIGLTGILTVEWKIQEPPSGFKAPIIYRLQDLKRIIAQIR